MFGAAGKANATPPLRGRVGVGPLQLFKLREWDAAGVSVAECVDAVHRCRGNGCRLVEEAGVHDGSWRPLHVFMFLHVPPRLALQMPDEVEATAMPPASKGRHLKAMD
jgi:hypothetical protein